MMGLSTSGSISLGWALVAGRKRVPNPAAGKTALRTRMVNSDCTFCDCRLTNVRPKAITTEDTEVHREKAQATDLHGCKKPLSRGGAYDLVNWERRFSEPCVLEFL